MEKLITFYPVNGYLWVKKIDNMYRATESEFVMPSRKDRDKITLVEILNTSDQCKFPEKVGQKAVVLESMIEDVKYKNQTFFIVPETAVFGFIFDESEIQIREGNEGQ